MIYEHNCYRQFLKLTLVERIGKNPAYSMRALAKDLDLRPSHLSGVYQGKSGLSIEKAMKISGVLNLTQEESEYFCLLVEFDRTKNMERKELLQKRINSFKKKKIKIHDLSLDLFRMISEWYHLPIIEMTRIPNFSMDGKIIAKRLGITKVEAETALERLERLSILEKNAEGLYTKCEDNVCFSSKIPNEALRKYHRQMFLKSIDTLKTQLPAEKYIGTETLAISPQQMPQAKVIINEMRHKLINELELNENPTDIYHLGIQFFRITKPKEIQ